MGKLFTEPNRSLVTSVMGQLFSGLINKWVTSNRSISRRVKWIMYDGWPFSSVVDLCDGTAWSTWWQRVTEAPSDRLGWLRTTTVRTASTCSHFSFTHHTKPYRQLFILNCTKLLTIAIAFLPGIAVLNRIFTFYCGKLVVAQCPRARGDGRN